MADLLVTGILLLIIGAAAVYIWKAKKRGVKCIGCPICRKMFGKRRTIQCAAADAIVQKNRKFQGKPALWKRCGPFI